MKQLLRWFALLFCMSNLLAADELLKNSDVHKVMQKLFQQHVDKKAMSTSILKNALKIYIDEFDHERIYLLQSEVQPYLHPSDAKMEEILNQYKHNELNAYIQLNELIQKSIIRARKYRQEIEKVPEKLILDSRRNTFYNSDDLRDIDGRRYFPKNDTELKQRIKLDLLGYIRNENKRYGDTVAKMDTAKIIANYELHIRHDEDRYLATDDNGKPLPAAESENLFVLHVLKSLANSLDAHTKVMDNSEAYKMKIRLEKEYVGVGIVLKKHGDKAVIANFVPGSSVEKSGAVQVNDRILAVNGQNVDNEPFDHILEMIRNDKTPVINLKLERLTYEDGKAIPKNLDVKLKRETITVNDGRVESSYKPFGNGIIGEIKLHMFYQGNNGVSSENDMRDAIKKLQQQGNLRGLILDLRDNSGGFLLQAVKVASMFISSGIIVISKYSNGEEHFYRDIDGKTLYEGPLVVLTSKGTASAAEIVAQALQDYGVALIVGDEQTYGKGTIQSQTVTDSSATSYFKVTVGKYYTVSGNTPQLQGVKADILVPSLYEAEAIGEEYLDDTIAPDRIPAAYKDPLSDVEPEMKPWYMRYYASHLQQKMKTWKNMVPYLKERSAKRIADNKTYQQILQSRGKAESPTGPWLFPDVPKNGEREDLQMTEAVEIVKDMINNQKANH